MVLSTVFKMLVIQDLYNLSDADTQRRVLRDLLFLRFVGIEIGENVPDASTLWAFHEMLKREGLIDTLHRLEIFRAVSENPKPNSPIVWPDSFLRENGFEAKCGKSNGKATAVSSTMFL